MNHPTYYSPEELTWIIANAKDFTPNEIAWELGLGETVIRNIGTRYKLKFKKKSYLKGDDRKMRIPKLIPDPPKVVYERPPALYTQVKSPYGISSDIRKL